MFTRSKARVLLALSVCALGAPISSRAGTVAYWRFEEGPAGAGLQSTQGTATTVTADSTGNGNALQTYDSSFTSPTYDSNVANATVPQTGAANNFSFHFSPNQDIYSNNAVGGGPTGNTINDHHFGAFTIEATALVTDTGRYDNVVGKDGSPLSGQGQPLSSFEIKRRGDDGRWQMEWLDGAGNSHSIESSFVPSTNTWYRLAAVSDGTTASFYIKGPSDSGYVLQGSTAVSGGIYDSTANWTVGRGFYNGNITDWLAGNIDEVRVSDVALAPAQLLGSAVPEPTGVGLVMLGGVGVLWRRRRSGGTQ